MGDHAAEETSTKSPLFTNKLYDKLKFIVQIVLPALATLYLVLAQQWDLPDPEKVAATITAVAAFLGVLLGVSTKQYNQSEAKFDGALVVDTSDPVRDSYSLELGEPLESLKGKTELAIKIQDVTDDRG